MAALRRMLRVPRCLLMGMLVAVLVTLGSPAPASASLIGELSGTVTGGGAALPNVWVTLTPVTEDGDPTGGPTRTLTDDVGRYEFPEVYDRNVTVHVRAPLFGTLVDTYWPDAHSFEEAGIIEISSWPVTADVDLPNGGSVTGRVVDVETGAPVPGARVTAMIVGSPESGPVGLSGPSAGPGSFAISGLPPVPLELRVRPPADGPYLAAGPSELFEGLRIDGARTTSEVAVGLRRGAEIRGTVRDDRGAPVAGASIKIVGCMPNCPLIVTSDSSGAYRIIGVAPGSRLGVVAWKGDQLVRQWYPGRDNASAATDIALGPGDLLDNVDFALTRGAFMTVEVTGADNGTPLPGAIVLLVSATNSFQRHFALRSTDDPDQMRLGPVTPGAYTLSVMPGSSNPGYISVDRATSPGLGPQGIIELAAEDDEDIVVELPPAVEPARSAGPRCPEGAVDESPSGDSGSTAPPTDWPGLSQGFLAPRAT